MARWSRREFLAKGAGAALTLAVLPKCGGGSGTGTDTGTGTPRETSGQADTDTAADTAAEAVGAKATVYAVLGSELSELYQMGLQAAQRVGIVPGALEGRSVFIKPNFVAIGMEVFGVGFDPASGECTKPELVVAVAEACLQAGAAHVTIGEGSQAVSWDWATVRFLEGSSIDGATDLKAAVANLNLAHGAGRVELLCTHEKDEWELIPSTSGAENVKDGIHVARAFALADHVVSMPVIKTHQWATVTSSMKNYIGLCSALHHGSKMGTVLSRCKLHLAYKDATCHGVANAGISGAYVDLHKWRVDQGRQDFAIVDGSICLEGSGPHKAPVNNGLTMHMKQRNAAGRYFLLAGRDFVAVDSLVAQIVGYTRQEVPSLVMCANAGLGEQQDVALDGAELDGLRVPDWQKPVMKGEDYFTNVCPG